MSEWQKLTDEDSGYPYYYNTVTGESSWDPPEGFVEEQVEEPLVDGSDDLNSKARDAGPWSETGAGSGAVTIQEVKSETIPGKAQGAESTGTSDGDLLGDELEEECWQPIYKDDGVTVRYWYNVKTKQTAAEKPKEGEDDYAIARAEALKEVAKRKEERQRQAELELKALEEELKAEEEKKKEQQQSTDVVLADGVVPPPPPPPPPRPHRPHLLRRPRERVLRTKNARRNWTQDGPLTRHTRRRKIGPRRRSTFSFFSF